MLEQVHQPVQSPIFEPQSGPEELMDFAPPTGATISDLLRSFDNREPLPKKKRRAQNSSNTFVSVLPIAPPDADMAAYSAILAAAMSASSSTQSTETMDIQTTHQNSTASVKAKTFHSLKALVLDIFSSALSTTGKYVERARKVFAG